MWRIFSTDCQSQTSWTESPLQRSLNDRSPSVYCGPPVARLIGSTRIWTTQVANVATWCLLPVARTSALVTGSDVIDSSELPRSLPIYRPHGLLITFSTVRSAELRMRHVECPRDFVAFSASIRRHSFTL